MKHSTVLIIVSGIALAGIFFSMEVVHDRKMKERGDVIEAIYTAYDDLDSLSRTNVGRCVLDMEWFIQNGQFEEMDGTLASATQSYVEWKDYMKESDREMQRISKALSESLSD